MDIEPSSYAAWSPESATAELAPLAPEVRDVRKKVRRTQRAMDRSRRAMNPDCFNPDGTFKKGAKCKKRSKQYERLAIQLADEQFARAWYKHFHRESFQEGWQKLWGRSIQDRAPSMFENMLKRKAENAGGSVHNSVRVSPHVRFGGMLCDRTFGRNALLP